MKKLEDIEIRLATIAERFGEAMGKGTESKDTYYLAGYYRALEWILDLPIQADRILEVNEAGVLVPKETEESS